ncbi:DNA replication and repair protein RecO [Anaerosporobacter mobilis DSM 15930]|uniref:DNA repair protein RecO n=1 Tax=Anaerosporobacter mobilis DSM 15930 TaxID=1120996 RepID=A0A1M7JW15_9FIRM|nr:DNA repair protein RecO [Anaerosporobacter mobilis]SHM57101.1 DNA replication and repair protein RecO [Anaerosporobacter mobilis DSM 15930]
MISPVIVTGIVLASMPVGEYDKRVVLLTKERGKITAFAKGARKQNSALLACAQPFTFGQFTVYEGRTSYQVNGCDVQNYFVELRNNLEAVTYGLYFCEFAEYLTRENIDESAILKLLYQSLRALTKGTIPYPLIRYIFELKIMTLNGEAVQVFECVKCGKKEKLNALSLSSGGLVCLDCLTKEGRVIHLQDSTIYAMQFIIASSIEKLYTFTVSDSVLSELRYCMKHYITMYIDKEFKTLEMLDMF